MMALWPRVRGPARTGGLVLAACLAALVVFDVLAYFFLPASLATFAPGYRRLPLELRDMRGYYRADPVLGFDIAPGLPGHHLHHIAGARKVPAASNDLGCRDPRSLADIQQLGEYTYFAGDSFTWGYAREDHAFPRVYERASGNPSLNCGVIGTGQLHQLEKFRRSARAIGRQPRLVVVALYDNDTMDDVWYPQFTVAEGLFVHFKRPVHRPQAGGLAMAGQEPAAREYLPWFWRTIELELLAKRYQLLQKGRTVRKERTVWEVLRRRARRLRHIGRRAFWERHSLLYQICARTHVCPATSSNRGADLVNPAARAASAMLHYRRSPYTRPHREALRAWAGDAQRHGYRLAVVLIPAKHLLGGQLSRDWRAGLRAHLDSLAIPHLDFAEHILAQGLRTEDLCWQHDGHLSEDGNRVLGEWLAEQLP